MPGAIEIVHGDVERIVHYIAALYADCDGGERFYNARSSETALLVVEAYVVAPVSIDFPYD
jgi:hypothetical protein